MLASLSPVLSFLLLLKPNNYGQSQSFSLEVIIISIAPTTIFNHAPVSIPTPALRTYQQRPYPPTTPQDSCITLTDSQPSHQTQ